MKNINVPLWIAMYFLLFNVGSTIAADPCVDCHKEQTPGPYAVWAKSAHASKDVSCSDCHGDDHDAILAGDKPVDSKVCGSCHAQAYAEHSTSKHGLGLHVGWGCTRSMDNRDQSECGFCHQSGSTIPFSQVQCARFLKQSSSMGELGCNRCHQVENSCASCHSNHSTDSKLVQNPNVCAKCHMGPDHPQWEMWETSQHGTLYRSGGADLAPDCQRCHMPSGSHNVSFGITKTPGGASLTPDITETRRAEMIRLCSQCHATSFVTKELLQADTIWQEQTALVAEARKIIEDVYDRGALDPMPANRPVHPQRGTALVLDSQMLYEDISHIERLFFKMKKYDFSKAFKGAYHQNPAYTHWYGNAEVKMTLEDIKAEASRLLKHAGLSKSTVGVELTSERGGEPSSADTMDEELLYLKKRFERRELTGEEYEKRKREILESFVGE